MTNTTFDPNDFASCVTLGMNNLNRRKEQMEAERYEWNVNINSCRWAIEQAILNRKEGVSMMGAVCEYTDSIERKVETFNGICQ